MGSMICSTENVSDISLPLLSHSLLFFTPLLPQCNTVASTGTLRCYDLLVSTINPWQ